MKRHEFQIALAVAACAASATRAAISCANATYAPSAFGAFLTDAATCAPVYNLTYDAFAPTSWEWQQSRGGWPLFVNRTDVWFTSGNERLNLAHSDLGHTQVFMGDRSFTWLNAYDPDHGALSGGFSYVTSSAFVAASPFGLANVTAPSTSRMIGSAWSVHSTSMSIPCAASSPCSLRITHNISTLHPNDSAVVDDVTLELLSADSSAQVSLTHWEFWDVNWQQLQLQLVRSWVGGDVGDALRRDINHAFVQTAQQQSVVVNGTTLSPLVSSMRFSGSPFFSCSCDYGLPAPCPPTLSAADVCGVNYFPEDVFLALLETSDGSIPFDAAVSKAMFFNDSSAAHGAPQTVACLARQDTPFGCPIGLQATAANASYRLYSPYTADDAYDQAAMLALATAQVLNAGETVSLRFAYGFVPLGSTVADVLQQVLSPPASDHSLLHVESLSSSATPVQQALAVELPWRSAELGTSTLWRSYVGHHVVPQGSTYLYLHGLDGALRDYTLSIMALSWSKPRLAREALLAMFTMQNASTGQFFYGMGSGNGFVTSALIHTYPSDLDIFAFLAVSFYVSVTMDVGVLSASVPYYPRDSTVMPPGATSLAVLDHLRAAFVHLTQSVGVGDHGCLRLLEGDWDDGILTDVGSIVGSLYTILYGESIPNCAMATVILPRAAAVLQASDPTLASDMIAFAASLRPAVRSTWSSRWFGRAWLKDANNVSYLYQNDNGTVFSVPTDVGNSTLLNLQSQIWQLMDAAFPLPNTTALLSPAEATSLVQTIQTQLISGSPIGPGLTPGGEVWPAISQWLTIALSCLNASQGTDLLMMHTFQQHVTAFPSSWLGVWSGPDGFVSTVNHSADTRHVGGWVNGTYADVPGWTWGAFGTTPMTDWPVSNSNAASMFVLAGLTQLGLHTYWQIPPSDCMCGTAPCHAVVDAIVIDADAARSLYPDGVVVRTAVMTLEVQPSAVRVVSPSARHVRVMTRSASVCVGDYGSDVVLTA